MGDKSDKPTYYQLHREEMLARSKEYYKAHRQEYLAYYETYYRENKAKLMAKQLTRRQGVVKQPKPPKVRQETPAAAPKAAKVIKDLQSVVLDKIEDPVTKSIQVREAPHTLTWD